MLKNILKAIVKLKVKQNMQKINIYLHDYRIHPFLFTMCFSSNNMEETIRSKKVNHYQSIFNTIP